MANKSQTSGIQAHTPAITPATASSRLTRCLQEIPASRDKRSAWVDEVKIILADFYGQDSQRYRSFLAIRYDPGSFRMGDPSNNAKFEKSFREGIEVAKDFLAKRIVELQEIGENIPTVNGSSSNSIDSRKIFLVHGHNHGVRDTVARFLEKLDLEPVILEEHPNQSQTIIEKFERHSDVGVAVVIFTGDDEGKPRAASNTGMEIRARQNVIFEFGYFCGKLDRRRTIALIESGVQWPSDMDGILHIDIDNSGAWKLQLVRELKAAGIGIDANKAYS